MKEVKRLSLDMQYPFQYMEDEDGNLVYYKDYEALAQQLTATTDILKSAGIEADTVQAGVMELVDKLRIKQNHIKLRDTYIEELEQRAEAAEAKADNLNNGWLDAISERDDARAKLAELEKQEPVGTVSIAIDLNAARAEGADAAAAKIRKAIPAFKDIHCGAVKECADIAEMVATQFSAGNAGKDGV